MVSPGDLPEILADSSGDGGVFEGPEKLLEIWFAPSPSQLPSPDHHLGASLPYRASRTVGAADGEGWLGLRKIRRSVWEEMLDLVKCKILSVMEGEDIDAYLLSESSLFVSPHQIILKTCGTTLNLLGLEKIIEIARQYCGMDKVYRCFYSRKSFFFPERQQGVHRGWQDEVAFLDSIFECGGSAYTVGPMNGDHWLLYMTNPLDDSLYPPPPQLTQSSTSSSTSASLARTNAEASSSRHPRRQDTTLEILMTHLSPEGRAPFFHPPELTKDLAPEGNRSGHFLGQVLSTHLGIDTLFPGHSLQLDSFGFDPCGYSANGLITRQNQGDGQDHGSSASSYFTIHTTPEEDFSYSSFETNLGFDSTPEGRQALQSLIRRVVSIFQPGRLSVTLFVSTPDITKVADVEANKAVWETISKDLLGKKYVRRDRIGYEFADYDLLFGCYQNVGFEERAAGEDDVVRAELVVE